MAGYSPERAMREFLRRGGRDQAGLDDLARRVAERRRELTERHNLDGTLQEIRELLDKAVLEERKQLARDVEMDDGDRALREMQLENLPPNVASAVSELSSYDWQSREARETYEQIKDLLGRELLDQRFAGMKQALENATDEDRAAINAMLEDLNELLEKHQRGEDTQEDFEEFMDKHGDFFPENPQNIDELLDAMAQRAAAAQRMLNSMSAEQRAELMELSQQAFGSPALMESLSRLDSNLQSLRPGEDWGGVGADGRRGGPRPRRRHRRLPGHRRPRRPGRAAQPVLRRRPDGRPRPRQARPPARRRGRGRRAHPPAARAGAPRQRHPPARHRRQPAADPEGDAPARQGAAPRRRREDVRPPGPARAAPRRRGRRAVRRHPRPGSSATPSRGTSRARCSTASYAAPATRPARRSSIEDVEVQETEARTQACVALLVDTSFSMAMDGRWVPMKRTALALHTLIKSRFRGDALQLIGFGRYAETMEIEQLTALDSKWDKGTNLHHALLLANRHFRKHPSAQPVLLIVTDGEPTSHLEPDGEVYFAYPPHPLTVAYAVRELDNARRLGAQTTFFRLGEDPGLARFIDSMADRVEGRVVAPELDDLGAAVVGSYLGSRTSYRSGFGGYGGDVGGYGDWFGGRGFWVGD